MHLKPLNGRVVLKRKEAKTSKGGILLPESAQEKPVIGEVVAVGEGRLDKQGRPMPLTVKIGDLVLFPNYSGTEYKADEEEFLVIAEDDLLAVVK
ncbi:MAG: co-chaperone GroES [Parachlamydiales bacterium]|jgi:chaperonin GroES